MDLKQAMLAVLLFFAMAASGCVPDNSDSATKTPFMSDTNRPTRIISLDLCADQYLFALADRSQILALSRNADDPGLSAIADRVSGIREVKGSAEEVLRLQPDLVLVGPYQPAHAMRMIGQMQYPTSAITGDSNVDDIIGNIRSVAKAVGHVDRGERLIADMKAQLAVHDEELGAGRVAAYYQRRGFVTGTGTLVDDLMRRIGLRNLAATDDFGVLGRLSVEEMALKRPDFLIMEEGSLRPNDRGTEMLTHPVLARAFPADRQLIMPQALTTCGGPGYPRAVSALAKQIRAADALSYTAAR